MITSTPVSVLERADVAAVAADDPALHLVVGQLDQPGGRLARLLGGEARIATARMLRARRSASALVSSSICCRQTGLVARLVLDLGDQQLLRLRGGEPGDPLELAPAGPASPA